MRIVKDILGRLFALWAMVIFIITMLPVVLLMWIIGLVKEPGRTSAFRTISKLWMQFFFFITGCSLKIKGKENFIPGKKYIVVCNHNSLMDIPVSTPFIPGANKTIAKIEMSRIPLFGLIYKRGAVLVDRKDKDSRRDSFKKMKNVLNMGMHMCIYPEGTRNKTNEPLKEFHNGAFKLAVETATPVLPALLFNTRKAFPLNKPFFFWPVRLEMHFLPEITVTTMDDYEVLKVKVHDLMARYYLANQLL